MLSRFDTQRILVQLVRELFELDQQIAELENGPHCTVLCMHCKEVFDLANNRWRDLERRAHPPDPASHFSGPTACRGITQIRSKRNWKSVCSTNLGVHYSSARISTIG